MNEPTALVSVVTATYNMGHYVCEAVDSVLGQDYPAIEIVVVDDGSTDDTLERLAVYADDPRVKVIHQENQGQTVAKNRGLAETTGAYVGFCDADNRWRPGKLALQLEAFRTSPNTGVVYGDLALIDDQGRPKAGAPVVRHSGRITAKLLVDNFVTFNTTLIPRAVLDQVGGFDERLRMAIDYDLWLRISLQYTFHYLDTPLVDYRIWGGQMSHRTGERMENFFRLLENFLSQNPSAVSSAEAKHAWAHSYTTRAIWLASVGRHREAWQDFRKALIYRPQDLRLWKSMVKATLGMSRT